MCVFKMEVGLCPGRYCGRTAFSNGSYSRCGACPRGYGVTPLSTMTENGFMSMCRECNDSMAVYDWLYLGFMWLLPFVLHLYYIELNRRLYPWRPIFFLFVSSTVETVLAAVLTILLTQPIGTFEINCCHSEQLSDWYTMFFNPSPNYESTIHCTNEAVFPLQTIVFIFNGICVIIMLIVRPLLSRWKRSSSHTPTYMALYFFPVLSIIHAIFSGLIYYTFPYITLFLSVIILVYHLAIQENQQSWALIKECITKPQHIAIILILWLIHAYGIVSLVELLDIKFNPAYLLLVPLPTLFYVFTTSVSDPEKMYQNYY